VIFFFFTLTRQKSGVFLTPFFVAGVASNFALYVQADHGNSSWVLSDAVHEFSRQVNVTLSSLGVAGCRTPCLLSLAGYWALRDMGLPEQAAASFSVGHATYIALTVNVDFSSFEAIAWADRAQTEIAALQQRYIADAQVSLLGIPSFVPVMIHDIELNLGSIDAIVVPLAFAIFLLMVKSVRLLLVPIVGMLLSLAFSFASGTILSYFMPVMSYLPSLLMSITIAMSFDYGLFLSLRFREELMANRDVDSVRVVATVMNTAGHTILVSGVILCITFITMAAFPLTFVRVTGICAALSILLSVAVHLLCIPSLLLAFPTFFSKCVEPASCCGRTIMFGARPVYDALSADGADKDDEAMRDSNWYRLGWLNSRMGYGLLFVLLCVAVAAPLSYVGATYTQSDSLLQDLPRSAQITQGYKNFSAAFGPGHVYPTQLLLVSNDSLLSANGFALCNELVARISNATGDPPASWSGVCVAPAPFPPAAWWQFYESCHREGHASGALCKALLLEETLFVNGTGAALLLTFSSANDPLAPAGRQWLLNARAAVDRALAGHSNVVGYLVGTPPDSWDSIDEVSAFFPIIIGSSLVIVLLMVGLVFRSILIPLRSVLSLLLTVGCVFGCAALIYDNGVLNWLHWESLKDSGGLTWLIPVVTFQIIIGISLDYDIYLLSRVFELRQMGYDTADSIRLAQYKTGPVISVAGIIMVFAFSGLLLSSTTSLNQMGFLLAFAALVDTFVFRALFVPSFMALVGEANWFPRRYAVSPHRKLAHPHALRWWCCGARAETATSPPIVVGNVQEQ
jgi:RND superfamily putative drug exporter